MKLNGKKLEGPAIETVVLPRENGDLVFKCQAILDYTEFEQLVKEPVPPMITRRGEKVPTADPTDPTYKKAQQAYALKRFSWMIMKSLEATPALEWETVKANDPSSWENIEKELKDAGLTGAEVGRIFVAATTANGLNEERIKEARARFFNMVNQEKEA